MVQALSAVRVGQQSDTQRFLTVHQRRLLDKGNAGVAARLCTSGSGAGQAREVELVPGHGHCSQRETTHAQSVLTFQYTRCRLLTAYLNGGELLMTELTALANTDCTVGVSGTIARMIGSTSS